MPCRTNCETRFQRTISGTNPARLAITTPAPRPTRIKTRGTSKFQKCRCEPTSPRDLKPKSRLERTPRIYKSRCPLCQPAWRLYKNSAPLIQAPQPSNPAGLSSRALRGNPHPLRVPRSWTPPSRRKPRKVLFQNKITNRNIHCLD